MVWLLYNLGNAKGTKMSRGEAFLGELKDGVLVSLHKKEIKDKL